jgi:predicted dehydrogenase
MLRIGVVGAGHLGKIHIKCIKQIADYQLVGFYDIDPENSAKVQEEYQVKHYSNLEELIDLVDVIDIVTPTLSHYDVASKGLRKGKHIFIEKPITTSLDEASKLINLAEEAGVKVQVGHVERFNPCLLAAQEFIHEPKFIEAHRLAVFNPRGTDVPVILDLMIHDIDIVLSLVKSRVRKVSASGVSIISDTPDIANARIEFENGCVANLTASRISLKNMRKTRIFQNDAYISLDFLTKETEIVRIDEANGKSQDATEVLMIDPGYGKPMKQISFEKPEVKPINAIMAELEMFYKSIITNTEPIVPITDGYNALDVAYQIIEKLNIR